MRSIQAYLIYCDCDNLYLPFSIKITISTHAPNTVPVHLILPRASMFKDQTFAWQLLEYEILIETKDEPDGLDISNLLQLYMVQ